MAEFKAGDRVVKMSGIGAGKYGTVNTVMENGTLNVTFDGERLPRYCDPMRCGQVATNAKFKAANAAPKGLMPTTKLRLKEDFSDEYGSYKKGSVFPMYAMGGINPKFGTMVVPGRGVTLQIPWEKLEVVNACARNADPKAYDHSGRLVKVGDTLETRKGLAEIVRIKGLQGHESVASWVGVSYKPGGNSVDEWLMCGMHGVLGVGIEAQNAVARNAVARNNVGDCFSDATAWLEDAYKAASNPSKSKTMIARARQEVGGPYGVLSYDGVDAKSKRHLSATLAAIDKAASNPTPENIMAARWESEKGRAHADGGSPRKAFWS